MPHPRVPVWRWDGDHLDQFWGAQAKSPKAKSCSWLWALQLGAQPAGMLIPATARKRRQHQTKPTHPFAGKRGCDQSQTTFSLPERHTDISGLQNGLGGRAWLLGIASKPPGASGVFCPSHISTVLLLRTEPRRKGSAQPREQHREGAARWLLMLSKC